MIYKKGDYGILSVRQFVCMEFIASLSTLFDVSSS